MWQEHETGRQRDFRRIILDVQKHGWEQDKGLSLNFYSWKGLIKDRIWALFVEIQSAHGFNFQVKTLECNSWGHLEKGKAKELLIKTTYATKEFWFAEGQWKKKTLGSSLCVMVHYFYPLLRLMRPIGLSQHFRRCWPGMMWQLSAQFYSTDYTIWKWRCW